MHDWIWWKLHSENTEIFDFEAQILFPFQDAPTLLACRQSIDTFKAKFTPQRSHKVFNQALPTGSRHTEPAPPNTPDAQTRHRSEHAGPVRGFHHIKLCWAKWQLGQQGQNLPEESAANPQITFGGSLESKWLSKFILQKKKKRKKSRCNIQMYCVQKALQRPNSNRLRDNF